MSMAYTATQRRNSSAGQTDGAWLATAQQHMLASFRQHQHVECMLQFPGDADCCLAVCCLQHLAMRPDNAQQS